jgi:adenylate cyclase
LETLATPGSICLSDHAYQQIKGKLALEVSDMGEQQLKNIAQPVRVYGVRLDGAATRPALSLPDRPSIAVLPFQNMSGDPEQEYFADGVVEDIITALSRIRWLFVIARNSSFTYKGRAVDVKQVGRELGVRYVLEGSVRKAANRVRVTGQLIDVSTGAHLWGDRFEGALEDIFDLQDQVTASVIGAIAPQRSMPRSSVLSVSRPTASMPTTIFCAEWRAITGGPGRRSTRRCRCSTRQSSSTPISLRPTAWPLGATLGVRLMAG